MNSLRYRRDSSELLDSPSVSVGDLERSLSDLEWANKWLGGRRMVLSQLIPLLGDSSSFLDVGCGSGDMLREIAKVGQEKNCHLRLAGIDVNPRVLQIAKTRCAMYREMEFFEGSAINLPFPEDSFDVVFSSTFLHHLPPTEAGLCLLESLRVAKKQVVIVDLMRSWISLIGVLVVGRFAFGRLSRYDGITSIKRAYRPKELSQICDNLGIMNARVVHSTARLTLVIDKT